MAEPFRETFPQPLVQHEISQLSALFGQLSEHGAAVPAASASGTSAPSGVSPEPLLVDRLNRLEITLTDVGYRLMALEQDAIQRTSSSLPSLGVLKQRVDVLDQQVHTHQTVLSSVPLQVVHENVRVLQDFVTVELPPRLSRLERHLVPWRPTVCLRPPGR